MRQLRYQDVRAHPRRNSFEGRTPGIDLIKRNSRRRRRIIIKVAIPPSGFLDNPVGIPNWAPTEQISGIRAVERERSGFWQWIFHITEFGPTTPMLAHHF